MASRARLGPAAGLAEPADLILRETRPLVRATRSTNLDIVRAAAALLVLTGHSYLLSGHYLNPTDLRPDHLLITNMAAGVWLFFALSGFLIAAPSIDALVTGRPLPGLAGYAVRRATRIYPVYVVAFLVAAVVAPVSPITHWWSWPLHLTLLHNLVPGEEQAILFASWTLTIEVFFYASVPLAARVIRRFRPGPVPVAGLVFGILAVWVASTGWTAVAGMVQPVHVRVGLWLRFLFPATAAMFCPGLLVAVAVVHERQGARPWSWWESVRARPGLWLAAAAVLAMAGCLIETRTDTVVYDLQRIPFAIASGIAVAVAAAAQERRSRPARLMGQLGLISYGIYLWQAVVLQVVMGHKLYRIVPLAQVGDPQFLVHLVVMLAVTVPMAWLSWTRFERPIMRFSRRAPTSERPTSDRRPAWLSVLRWSRAQLTARPGQLSRAGRGGRRTRPDAPGPVRVPPTGR